MTGFFQPHHSDHLLNTYYVPGPGLTHLLRIISSSPHTVLLNQSVDEKSEAQRQVREEPARGWLNGKSVPGPSTGSVWLQRPGVHVFPLPAGPARPDLQGTGAQALRSNSN